MKKITDYIWDVCSVFGAIFLLALVMSCFFPTFKILEESKIYLIVLFICMVVGKYVLDRNEK